MDKLIKTKLLYKSSVIADVLIGLSIILAGYFYYYENKKIVSNIANPENVNYAIKIVLAVIIIVTWMWLCFQNGVKKRRSFLVWTLCLWIVPQIARYIINAIDTGVYATTLQGSFTIFAKYLANINYLSLRTFGDMIQNGIGISYDITLNIMVILFEGMFLLGLLISERYNITEKHNKRTHSAAENREDSENNT